MTKNNFRPSVHTFRQTACNRKHRDSFKTFAPIHHNATNAKNASPLLFTILAVWPLHLASAASVQFVEYRCRGLSLPADWVYQRVLN